MKVNQPPEDKGEGAEERKKRLLEQRELIKKKKMEERKVELNAYVEKVFYFIFQKQEPEGPAKVSEEELEKRRKLMQKLKDQLKD